MTRPGDYVIRGGVEGRERLRVLGRVMRDSSASLFERLGVRPGLVCLDVGCGGGDATLELARRVAPDGRVVGIDIDGEKVDIARDEAEAQGITNVEFRVSDIRDVADAGRFDVVYARFLLTHLSDPAAAVRTFGGLLRNGGAVGLEDIDFSGHFTYPESTAFHRYHELYCATVRRRGGDPNIGQRLPRLLKDEGFAGVDVRVVQPVALQGEAKLLNALTMENIAGAVVADGLASPEEIAALVRALYEFAADPDTLAGLPRVVQTWASRPH